MGLFKPCLAVCQIRCAGLDIDSAEAFQRKACGLRHVYELSSHHLFVAFPDQLLCDRCKADSGCDDAERGACFADGAVKRLQAF